MAHDEVKHDFHLVNPSPWPLLGSLAVIVTALGGVTYMKGLFGLEAGTWWLLAVGLAMVIWVMFGWWREVIKEGGIGDHTPVVQIGLRYGMILFIASEVMFFVGWFWSWFDFSLFPAPLTVGAAGTAEQMTENLFYAGNTALGSLVPEGMEVLDPFSLPLLNTMILLCSGTTVTWAHHALIHGDREGLKQGLWATIALGVLFSAIQAYEYSVAPFNFGDNTYGSAFYMATGFHGFHVLVGTIFLAVCLFRAYKGHFTPRQHFGFEAAAWYWHFVDVVWLFLFIAVYVWGGAGAEYH